MNETKRVDPSFLDGKNRLQPATRFLAGTGQATATIAMPMKTAQLRAVCIR